HSAISIHRPDIVLAVDANLLGDTEAINSLADLPDEIAGGTELQQFRRAALGESAGPSHRGAGMTGPLEDEDIALRIGRHSGNLAKVGVWGQLQNIGGGKRNFRRGALGGGRQSK